MNKLSIPFSRSFWVVPGKFLAGYYPGSRDSATALRKLTGLLEHGVHHIVNLMEKDELNFKGERFVPYEVQLQNLAKDMNIPIKLVQMSIRDTDIPLVEGMVAILNEIDRAVEQNPIVYLHCWGGRGRTGTVVGCYLARHGMAVKGAALDLLQKLRQDDPIAHLPSPETKIQADFVRSWAEGK
ncbi:MAG: dual specificity protein phosphatase family protein [Deltaproteobacteria bacterium]|nr:MAG: dual specificity protein phosphatase family protein [Deltaproteobacteria bacterium]